MRLAIEASEKGLHRVGEGPFGAVIVKKNEVIAVGNNRVVADNDPTAHAEIVAIRQACQKLKAFTLDGCEIYTTCEPCPMCLSAIYWSHISKIYFGCSKQEAAEIGFDDDLIYQEIPKSIDARKIPSMGNILHNECKALFDIWSNKSDRINY